MTTSRLLAGVVLTLAMAGAHAFDFKTIGNGPTILYDAPSVKGGKLFIAPRGMPVEVVLTYGEWSKVRDAAGDLAWIESKLLSPRRNVVVRAPSARLRLSADDQAAVIMTADKGVLLELVDVQGPWARVRHRDGISGFVRASDVWGL
ncbi:MAG: SH3 domain-containing protein [Gammaproteobacteria bacterium]